MTFLSVTKSGTFSLNEKSNALAANGRTVYRFGFGESPFPPPPRIQEALRCATHRSDYTAVAGLPELRQKIAAFHHEVDGFRVAAEQVLVAPGTKPLLYNIMHAFQELEVYLPGPSWLSYGPQARLAGHQVFRIPTSYAMRWRVTPEALDDAIVKGGRAGRQKLLVLNYPGNPDGLSYSRDELQALAQVLEAHSVWVLSDEIYALLHHGGAHVSLASIYPERTLVTTGLSKWCGAGGWRLGALILPPEAPTALRDGLIGLASETYSCAAAPIQVAALTAYGLDATLHEFLGGQRRILRAVGQAIHRAVVDAGLQAHPPQGGFYLLLDFSPFKEALLARGMSTDVQLCDALLDEAGVALLPGSDFGMLAEACTARLAYVEFDGAAALAHADAIEGNVESVAAKMLDGINALGAWLR